MGALAKKVLEQRRREDPASQNQESLVDIVDQSAGSQNLQTGDPLPFRIHDKVTYKVPVIDKEPFQYHWQEHHGVVQAVDARWEMVTVLPSDEAEPWRIVPWVYCRKDEP